jgi:U3 small nucleolar ribonucleoprotein component
MDEETTIATPEYLAAREARMAEVHRQIYNPSQQVNVRTEVECDQCRKRTLATLDAVKTDMAALGESVERSGQELRFLAWQNVELKQQIAALKGEAGKK